MNSVQLAAGVIRRGNYVDHTVIVANQSYIVLIGRKQGTFVSATDVLKARNHMYINLCVLLQNDFLRFGILILKMEAEHDAETLVHI